MFYFFIIFSILYVCAQEETRERASCRCFIIALNEEREIEIYTSRYKYKLGAKYRARDGDSE